MKYELSRQSFEKYSDTKFHEYSSGGSRPVPCEGTAVQTEMMKLRVSFRNSAKAPKISGSLTVSRSLSLALYGVCSTNSKITSYKHGGDAKS